MNRNDLATVVAYLDGLLAPDEARAFERRLGTEPALARAFLELADTDEELRLALAAEAPPARAARRAWALPVAIAAGLVLVLGALAFVRRTHDARARVGVRFALVETRPSDADFNELLGFDADWLPVGMGYRGPDGDRDGVPAPAADAYAAALDTALRARVDAAFDASAETTPRAESFVLAFRPERRCHVVLVIAGNDRAPERLLPRGPLDLAFEAGRTYLLPEEPLRLPDDWRASRRVVYEPGILTRRGVDVTLAVRAAPVPIELLDELDDLLAQAPTQAGIDPVRGWLVARGFEVHALGVDPPSAGSR